MRRSAPGEQLSCASRATAVLIPFGKPFPPRAALADLPHYCVRGIWAAALPRCASPSTLTALCGTVLDTQSPPYCFEADVQTNRAGRVQEPPSPELSTTQQSAVAAPEEELGLAGLVGAAQCGSCWDSVAFMR